MLDITDTLQIKSDQLTADDLITGPIVVQLGTPERNDGEQPVRVPIVGRKPWYPCKTCRRLLVAAWGKDASRWSGRWVRLFRDPKVRFGGATVGGIRIEAMSDIPTDGINESLPVSKGKRGSHRVDFLRPAPTLAEVLADNGITMADVNRWQAPKPPIAEGDQQFAAWLVNNPKAIAAIKALVPQEGM